MKKAWILIIVLFPVWVFSQNSIQWNDDFSDGDFLQNPTWNGSENNFIVNANNQLQLNAPAGTVSRSHLTTSSEVFNDATWEFWVRTNNTTSNQNYSLVYIISDRADISGEVNGYYVYIGNTEDEISLYRQQGATRTKIIDGEDKTIDSNPVIVNIRVTRTRYGEFSLFRKRESTNPAFNDSDWMQEGTAVTDNHVVGSKYFGVLTQNSSANGKNYFFDNISVAGDKKPDEIPPVWLDLRLEEPHRLVLTFSEEVDMSAATFTVDNGMGSPVSVQLSSGNTVATLTFSQNFSRSVIYTVQANNVKDLAGNLLQETQKQVGIYESPEKGDLVINEVLFETADGVPEYFEIYNASNKILTLNNTYFSVRSPSTGKFTLSNRFPENEVLLPKSYLALTNNEVLVKEHFDVPASANVKNAASWSALNNTSAKFVVSYLALPTENGETMRDTVILDELQYDVKWHSVESTPNVSLERINHQQRTQIPTNWHSASAEVNFGTPGYENSRYMMPDTIPPVLIGLAIQEPNSIAIQFSEIINVSTATFSIDQEIGNSTGLTVLEDEMSLIVPFNNAFEKGKIYTLEILNIKDMAGNPLEKTRYQTGILETVESADLIINEILFDNADNATEYFEIYNKSGKVIDLSHVFFTIRNAAGAFSINNYFPKNSFIAPLSYLALTPEPELVRKAYGAPEEADILKADRWSALNNSGASLLMGNFNGTDTLILDEVAYDAKWHHSLIRNAKGVSLERINPDMPSQKRDSWHSAAAEVNYGTPGYKNSQFREMTPGTTPDDDNWFYPDPEAFSPDNDGREDVSFIHYKTEAEGFTANVIIFNAVGVKVTQLASNQILGSNGYLVWDGKTDRGITVNPGIYVLYVELINTDSGTKKIEKMPIVVSAR